MLPTRFRIGAVMKSGQTMANKKRKGFTLQSIEDRSESNERGIVKGAWMRSSAMRIRNTPLPPLIGREEPKDDSK